MRRLRRNHADAAHVLQSGNERTVAIVVCHQNNMVNARRDAQRLDAQINGKIPLPGAFPAASELRPGLAMTL